MIKMEKEIFKSKVITSQDIVNIIISIIGIVVAELQILEIRNNFKINNLRFVIYNIIICGVIIFMNILSIINRRREIKNELNIKKLEEKNKNLLEVSDDVRCFKHDFNNIIQAITGYIDVKDMNSLQKYFNSLSKDCHHINTIEVLNFQVLDNPAIYSLLVNKYKIAKENDIVMNIEILINMKVFNEKSYKISRILGVLLDNAIEACMESKEKNINVRFMNGREPNINLIIIENTYDNKNIDTNKIFEKHYTTKCSKKNSGLGLWKIKDIINKDAKLELFTSKDDETFKQELQVIK